MQLGIGVGTEVADQVIFIDDGMVVEARPFKELIANPKSVRLRDFLSRVR